MTQPSRVVYWDASAILSLLFADCHSSTALAYRQRAGAVHLLSTLAYVETCAVIARLVREKALSIALAKEAQHHLAVWPWRRTTVQPAWEIIGALAEHWPLRGTDLWHLACAVNLRRQLPELHLLTFDSRLLEAARGERLLDLED